MVKIDDIIKNNSNLSATGSMSMAGLISNSRVKTTKNTLENMSRINHHSKDLD